MGGRRQEENRTSAEASALATGSIEGFEGSEA